jgi:hypothetical protein
MLKLQTTFFAALISTFALAGCAGNDCEQAADTIAAKYEECGMDVSGGDGDGGEEVECTEDLGTKSLCAADCMDAAPCEVVKLEDLTSEDAMTYLECNADCAK